MPRNALAVALVWLLTLPRLATSSGKLFTASTSVIDLDPVRVEKEVVPSRSAWVMMYYADWCPHCHHYAPTFESIAAQFVDQADKVRFGAMNCPDFNAFCTKINVQGYPAVRTYHFRGETNSTGLAGSGPDKLNFHDEAEFSKWIQQNLPAQPALPEKVLLPTTRKPVLLPASAVVQGAVLRGNTESSVRATMVPAAAESPPADVKAAVLQEVRSAKHMYDAEVALLYSMRQGVFLLGEVQDETAILKGEPLAELQRWLDFVARSFPSKVARRDVSSLASSIRQAVAASSTGSSLDRAAFQRLLSVRGIDRVPPQAGINPNAYWRHCKNYTCGLWTLFHMLSQARSTSSISGEELLARVRGFVANFFGCTSCREHFLRAFDSCAFERCRLRADDQEGAARWLWQVHNDVTIRVAAESGSALPTEWPSSSACRLCWTARDGRFNNAAVGEHLRSEYWSPEWGSPEEEDAGGASAFGLPGNLPLLAFSVLAMAMFGACAACRLLRSAPGKETKDS